MGVCILAKRVVLELSSSTNFVYSLKDAKQGVFVFFYFYAQGGRKYETDT